MSQSVAPAAVYAQLGLPESYVIVDARTQEQILKNPRLLPGSLRAVAPLNSLTRTLPRTQRIAVYCEHGNDESHSLANELSSVGLPTEILAGGLEAWIAQGFATTRCRPELNVPGGSRWVTRERPKIDRLACPWLVRRFIDPNALFFYTPAHRVRAEAESLDAQPYDIADVTFSHRGPRCSFDAFLDEFELRDPVIERLATIVRAADTGELAQSPEAPGLLAVSLGLSANFDDDLELLERALPLYDALYAWCKKAHTETHSWPKKTIQ